MGAGFIFKAAEYAARPCFRQASRQRFTAVMPAAANARDKFQSLEIPAAEISKDWKSSTSRWRWRIQHRVTQATDRFVASPAGEALRLAWPTPNRNLFAAPERFFARTRANENYGRPGWTRDCGRRFHRGCDIAPVAPRATGRSTTVMFSDCAKNTEYPSVEPTFTCSDEVFAVCDGLIHEVCTDEKSSLLGFHIVLEHRWPVSRRIFFTVYGHLGAVEIPAGGAVRAGQCIGRMGQTSSSADAKNWMAVVPHLHFEVWNEAREPFDPEIFLRAFLSR